MTVDKVAEVLGIEKVEAYGLLHFMTIMGLVETGRVKKAVGARGKPATVYKVNQDAIDKLRNLLLNKVAPLADTIPTAPEPTQVREVLTA